MERFRLTWHVLLLISLPLAILFLSSNIALRMPEMYVYHFNDSQVTSWLSVDAGSREFAEAITSYLNGFGDEEFQMYEQNGTYRDPLFDVDESNMMARIKSVLTAETIAAALFTVVTVISYAFLYQSGKRALRRSGLMAICIGVVLQVLQILAIHTKPTRNLLYDTFIGFDLHDEALLATLLRSPFEKTYLIFASVLGFAMLMVFTYFHLFMTKEKRLFS
ncbi:MAG: DUF1461 domain-containing protein [Clostridia bacterium]|nr:DUF1461 domain-containing protein [Clostridia bacterium]